MIEFIVNYGSKAEQRREGSLSLSHFCKRLAEGFVDTSQALRCSQEEADYRLYLHVNDGAKSAFVAVVIVPDDVDVLVIGISF